jgi:GSCFA family
VAGQLATELQDVDYFPSYEVITNPWASYLAYEPNMRSVTEEGVDLVMKTFFRAQGVSSVSDEATDQPSRVKRAVVPSAVYPERAESDSTAVCDEELLDAFGPRP